MTRVAPLRRLARLARKRSPIAIGGTVHQAIERELGCRRTLHALTRAAKHDGPVVAGPFIGEVGFELLYWIPFLRRLLAGHDVDPDRVVSFTRGGAGAWYGDFASRSVEVFDLMPAGEFVPALHRQRQAAGHARQIRIGALERELIRRLAAPMQEATILHPRLVYRQFRHVWDGLEPVSSVRDQARFRPLARTARRLDALDLPADYVAVKPYFNTCFPDTAANRRFLHELLTSLSEVTEVVVMATRSPLDDHAEWTSTPSGVRLIGDLEPRENLAVQTEIVAGASALLSTYGGFSYLGPLVDVPTHALYSLETFNAIHLAAMLENAEPRAYELVRAGDPRAVEALVAAARGSRAPERPITSVPAE